MLSHPAGARRFVQPSFQVPVQAPLVDIFSPGLGNDEPERTKLGDSFGSYTHHSTNQLWLESKVILHKHSSSL